MYKANLILIHLLLLITFSLQGQVNAISQSFADFTRDVLNNGGSLDVVYGGGSRHNNLIKSTSGKTVEGSEYLNDNFSEGEIFTRTSKRFSGIPMRYNVYLDEIEVQMPENKIYKITNTGQILNIQLNKAILIFSHFVTEEGIKSGFLFELYNSKSGLYRRTNKILKERAPSNGIIPEVPARIADQPRQYYLKLKDSLPQLLKTRKGLLQMLGDHLPEMNVFLKKGKVKMNDEADLISVITYYDSL